MILVTGGTGFIGNVLVKTLVSLGYPVRLLLNPSRDYPQLPKGTPVEVAISSMTDERNLRASMKGVDTIFHLIGTEWKGIQAEYDDVDIKAAQMFSRVAAQMHVGRFFFMSHIGADKASAYNYLKAKANAEAAVKESGVPYTIIRSGIVYGEGDHFTTAIRDFVRSWPSPLLLPGGDHTRMQPIWVEDLVTCLLLCMDNEDTLNKTIELGGIEMFTFEEVVTMIMEKIGRNKNTFSLNSAWLRYFYIASEQWHPKRQKMYFWLDYLAEDRITDIDVLPRQFGLMPTRMSRNIDYLI